MMQSEDLERFRQDMICPHMLKARNPFSCRPLPDISALPLTLSVRNGLSQSIDLRPPIHFLRDSAYHTPRHYYTVACLALEIGRFNQLGRDDLDLLVATALIHDYGYRFLTSREHRVSELRLSSWRSLAMPIERKHILLALSHTIIDSSVCEAMQDLNMATAYSHRREPMSLMQRCLSDADVLQSCLSLDNYTVETELLKKEAQHTLCPVSSGFLESVGPMLSCIRGDTVHPLELARRTTLALWKKSAAQLSTAHT